MALGNKVRIIFDERTKNSHKVLLLETSFVHILSDSKEMGIFEKYYEKVQFTNTLKVIQNRNLQEKNFSFEFAFQVITKYLNCKHTDFKVYIFDDIIESNIFKLMIEFLNHSYSRNLTIEFNKNNCCVKDNEVIVFQSFL